MEPHDRKASRTSRSRRPPDVASVKQQAKSHSAGAPSQTDGPVTAIKVAAGIVPTVAVGAAVAVMLAYPLTEKGLRTIVAELAECIGSPITATPIAEAT